MDGEQATRKAFESILQNDFEQAIFWFERAIEQDPNNASYHYKLSITCARSGKVAKAIKHAEFAVRLDGKQDYRNHLRNLEAVRLVQQAEQCLNQVPARPRAALVLLRDAVEHDPLNLEAYLLQGIAYTAIDQYGKALQSIEEALRLDPHHETALLLAKETRARLRDNPEQSISETMNSN